MKVFTLIFLMFALIITMVACKEVNTDPTPTTAATTTQAPTTAGSVTTTDAITTSTATSAGTSTTDITTATTSTTTAVTTASLSDTDKFTLEPDRQDLPTYEQLCSAMRVGMYPSEVSSLVGNPQRIETYEAPMFPHASSTVSYEFAVFDSCDGDSIGVLILENFALNGKIYEYGIKYIITIAPNGSYMLLL